MKLNLIKTLLLVIALLIGGCAFSQVAPGISYSATSQTYTAGTAITALTVSNSGGAPTVTGLTTTFAGTGSAGNANGTGTGASFNQPLGVVLDAAGLSGEWAPQRPG